MMAFISQTKFFVVNDVIYNLLLALIVVGTVVRLLFRPAPTDYVRAMNIVALLTAITAALSCFGFFWNFYMAGHSGNRYETGTLLRSRVAGPLTDLIHWVHPTFPKLPWAPYWWIFYVPIMVNFCVWALWIPVVRRRPILILCATAPALIVWSWLRQYLVYIILDR